MTATYPPPPCPLNCMRPSPPSPLSLPREKGSRTEEREVRLYVTMIRLSIADAIQYRVESAIYFLYEMLPPIMMAFVWLAVYQEQTTVAGYAQGEMLAYTIGVMVLRGTVTLHVEWALDHEIRQGLLSVQLIRPFNYW